MSLLMIHTTAKNGATVNAIVSRLNGSPKLSYRVMVRVNGSPLFTAHKATFEEAKREAERMHESYMEVHNH
jgi:hypothetical protein